MIRRSSQASALTSALLLVRLTLVALTLSLCTQEARAQTSVHITLTQPWTDTGIPVEAGDTVTVKTSGFMDYFKNGCPFGETCIVGPNGTPWSDCPSVVNPFLAPGINCWSLIGRIGPNGPPFEVGSQLRFSAATSGNLYLGVNDNNFGDNIGAWTSKVTVGPTGGCIPNETTLCIDQNDGDGRFQIQASYSTIQGGGLSGLGHAIPLTRVGVTEGGLLWFFGASNPEMLIKIIDGCSLNGHFWVFLSATTNVAFTATVTDTLTGLFVSYSNSDQTTALPVADTSALACP